jgi:stearoyl-CoA desaturase (delta-9 desaturase)
MIFRRIPTERINWTTSSFLIGTFALTLTAVPLYIWKFGLDWFQIALFVVMAFATGMSITLGYHRLFSHITFQAAWPVRLFTLIFGAAAFENSALMWCSEHRHHHKHVDHDELDPYAISKGFFWAHIGWLLFKLNSDEPYDNVADLEKDPLVRWQDRYVQWIAVAVSFVFPAALGFLWNGWQGALGAFLIGGVARVVAVQHSTFFINSACHYFGNRPYSVKCSARDSWFMALFTFGEGYHNYHHEFQYDYRNGVKPWQWDPTKWAIWLLSKLGLVRSLRRVPNEKILLAQLAETQRQLEAKLATATAMTASLSESAQALVQGATDYLHDLNARWAELKRDAVKRTEQTFENSREALAELQAELRTALAHLKSMRMVEATL